MEEEEGLNQSLQIGRLKRQEIKGGKSLFSGEIEEGERLFPDRIKELMSTGTQSSLAANCLSALPA